LAGHQHKLTRTNTIKVLCILATSQIIALSLVLFFASPLLLSQIQIQVDLVFAKKKKNPSFSDPDGKFREEAA
jgi:hypothetical protein